MKGSIMSIRVSKDLAMKLARVLRDITRESKIETLALLSETGARIAFFSTVKSADPNEMSAIGAALMASTRLALEKIGFDPIQEIIARGERGFLFLRALDKFVLVGGASDKQTFKEVTIVLRKHEPELLAILKEVPEEEY